MKHDFRSFLHQSGTIAKNRLRQVLQEEHSKVKPELVEMMEHDIKNVVANYMEVPPKTVNLVVAVNGTDSSCECELSLEGN